MKFISKLFVRPVTVCVVVVLILAFGVISTLDMPVTLIPDMSIPAVTVSVIYPGAGSDSVESEVTSKISSAVTTVTQLTDSFSYSVDNASVVYLQFEYDIDLDKKRDEIEKAIATVTLPSGCEKPEIKSIDFNTTPVAKIAVSSEQGLEQAYDDALVLKDKISGINGVGKVDIYGNKVTSIDVRVKKGLELITLPAVKALSENLYDIPLGSIDNGEGTASIRNKSGAYNLDEIKKLPISVTLDKAVWEKLILAKRFNEAGTEIDVSQFGITNELFDALMSIDVSQIKYGNDETKGTLTVSLETVADIEEINKFETYSYLDGVACITVSVSPANGANLVSLVDGVKKIIKTENNSSTAILLEDNAAFINDSLTNMLSSMLIGGVLAIIVIFLFLRRLRSSMIISVTIPLSVLTALICMRIMGMSLNMVSLGGLAVGIGMLVDNSIVVLESITKHRETGKDAVSSAFDGTKEVASSLFASTFTTICVFLPIMFITGLTREIFTDLSWAVIFALSFSLIVAVTIIPAVYCLLHRRSVKLEKKRNYDNINGTYGRILDKVLKHKALTVLVAAVLFTSSIALVFTTGTEFLPSIDKGVITLSLNYGTSADIDNAEKDAGRISKLITEQIDSVERISFSIGKFNLLDTNLTADFSITLKESRSKKTSDVVEDIRLIAAESDCFRSSVREVDGVVATLTSQFSGLGLTVSGEDSAVVNEICDKINNKLIEYQGIKAISDDIKDDEIEYLYNIDRQKCSEYGVDYEILVQTLRAGIAGYTAVTISESDITVGFSQDSLESQQALNDCIIGFTDNGVLKLSDVCQVEETKKNTIIQKGNGKYQQQLNIETYGIDTGAASKIINEAATEVISQYRGYTYSESGVSSFLTDAMDGLVKALIVSVFLLFAFLACRFESPRNSVVVMLSIPFTFTGAFLSLFLTGTTLNVVSFIGVIMLMGVIVNNAIIMLDKIALLIKEGINPREAVISGCTTRLRPILMTTLTTILALLPLAIGIGSGSELMQPMGIAVMGGLTLGAAVSLFLIPVLYCAFKRINNY